VLFRPQRAAREPSGAVLRLTLVPAASGVRITLLKGRGLRRGTLELNAAAGWPLKSPEPQ
jgi:hypothetical protein